MSKILANEIANYGDNAPIDLKEGLNIPAGKPIQAAGIAGTSGQVLSSTGTSINWITPFDGDYTSLTNRPTIPAAQVNADWNATSGAAVILNKPTVPPLTSLVVNSAGTPSLTFNGANGQFTYTPPDLSNYDTAFGWGDHAQAGYVTTSGTQTISGAKTFSTSTTFSENVDFEGNPNGGAALSMQFYKGNGTNSDLDTLKFFNRSGITIGAGEGGGFTMRSWNNNSSYILISGDSFFIDGGTSTAIKIRTQFARNAIVCNSDNGGTGTVELYHSANGTATKKFETTSAGASVYGQLTAGGLTYPTVNGTNGHVLTSDGAGNVAWAAPTGGGGASVTISDTPPAASAGDLWWESDSGRLKIYYQDVDSAQWVDVNPPLAATSGAGGDDIGMFTGNLDAGVVTSDVYKKNLSQSQSNLISISELKAVVAASADFAAFKTNVAALTDS